MKNYKKSQTKSVKKSLSKNGNDSNKSDKSSKSDKTSKDSKKIDSPLQNSNIVKNKTVKATKKEKRNAKSSPLASQDKNKSLISSQVNADAKKVKDKSDKSDKHAKDDKSEKSKKKEKKQADKKTKSTNSNSNSNINHPTKTIDKKAPKNTSADESDDESLAPTKIVKALSIGGAVVDPLLANCQNYSVLPDTLSEHNSKYFTATLNYSDVKNNNNKFYLIQLLRQDNTNKYFLFTRWGRVGVPGSQTLANCLSLDQGKQSFLNKYHEKTTKGYDELIIDYSANEEKNEPKKNDKKKSKTAKSCLDQPVQDLMQLIYNINLMKQQMTEIGYDANKLPLGKLGKETLTQGYEILKEIEKVLDGTKKGDLYELSSNFYSKIPHNFGFQ